MPQTARSSRVTPSSPALLPRGGEGSKKRSGLINASAAMCVPRKSLILPLAPLRLDRKNVTPSKKGTGFVQPTKNHQEWHVDVSYINVGGSFYFLISVLDGFSRTIVHWELRETMKELDIELVIAKAIEKHPGVSPRIISDNGPQFIAIRRGGSRSLFVSTA
jgi:transposase InsO family protein